MDGNQKVVRSVCSAKGEKISNRGELNQFTCCHHSPLPKQNYCEAHKNEASGPTEERMDYEPLTRNRRWELGVDIDELTTEQACGKREAVTIRKMRSKTAGRVLLLFSPIDSAFA